MSNIYYTGIGSRETPEEILGWMQDIGWLLAKKGYTLRSGGADGADSAFEKGCDQANGKKDVYIPWKNFNKRGWTKDAGIVPDLEAAKEIVMRTHPAPRRLSQGAMKLHSRNPYQILGDNLNTPSDFVIAYTPNGKLKGGTATALRLAQENNIPVYNLGDPNAPSLSDFLVSIGLDKMTEEDYVMDFDYGLENHPL